MQTSNWPAVKYEKQIWGGSGLASYGPAAARADHYGETYLSAVPPKISELHPTASEEVQNLVQEAESLMQSFDSEHGEKMQAFAPILLRSEAAASSQIENLTASARQIFTAEIFESGKRNATEIVANTRSMQRAINLASDLSIEAIKSMHAELMKNQLQHTPGEFRKQAVWIGKGSTSPIGATFVAPNHAKIKPLMDDLADFSRKYDQPALLQAAIAHAQFETIHPFSDGNGRTGRAIVQAMLRRRRLTRNVAIPVSAGLLNNIESYHDALTQYREGNIEPIINIFAIAALKAVPNARQLVEEIDAVGDKWRPIIKARSKSAKAKLLEHALLKPVFTAESAAAEVGVTITNIYRDLRALEESGFLSMKAEYSGPRLWRQPEVLDAIDAFAIRAGRR